MSKHPGVCLGVCFEIRPTAHLTQLIRDSEQRRAKIMKVPRLANTIDPKTMPLDTKCMVYGGFKVLVDLSKPRGDTLMRFMIIVKANRDTEAGVMPEENLFAEMAKYHEELQKAGMLLDASGLKPTSKGWRVRYSGGKRTVIDGPFAETKELIAGYTLIQAKSKEEALEWTKRFPNPAIGGKDCEIEVRQLYELEDFDPSESIERFREMGVGTKK